MNNKEIITLAKKDQNLFTLNLAQSKKVMTVINKKPNITAITEQCLPTYLAKKTMTIIKQD